MAFTNPSNAMFQSQFIRDFPYGTDPNISVIDDDISYAFQMVNMNINQDLFGDQGSYTVGYNLLAAHYLVTNLRASSQGVNGQFNWLQSSKGVGAVSEAFSIPPWILDNAYLSGLTKTNYGNLYIQLILPSLVGPCFVAPMPANSL